MYNRHHSNGHQRANKLKSLRWRPTKDATGTEWRVGMLTFQTEVKKGRSIEKANTAPQYY